MNISKSIWRNSYWLKRETINNSYLVLQICNFRNHSSGGGVKCVQWPQSVSAKRLLWGFSFCFVDSWLKVYFFTILMTIGKYF